MAVQDTNRIFDGFQSVLQGQDAGRRANLIGEDQCAELENVICRGGSPRTRPGFPKLDLNFLNEVTYTANGQLGAGVDSEEAFTTGLFQGASYYDPSFSNECIMVSVGGRVFRFVPRRTTADIREISLANRNRSNVPIAYMVQADRYWVLQDGESKAVIFDGVTARRASEDELPVGTIMTYGMGRIILIGTDKRTVIFGDLYGSHLDIAPEDSVLRFTERRFLAEGGDASMPFDMGHIKGAIFYPQQDTSSGQGELLVFAEKGMASFFLSLPREQWKESAFQRMGLIEIGGRGHRAFTPVNGDIWFRSGDGWRTYRQARAEAKGWFQLPLSTEVGNYVDFETQKLLEFSSSIRFDNRLIGACTPYPNQGKPYLNGFVALDFNVLSAFGEATRPSWDGHWSGLKTLQLVEGHFDGQHRAFAFALDSDGLNAIYEVSVDDVEDDSGPITSSFVSRSFNFESPFNEDELYDADLWFDEVRADTTLQAWYKPDQYPDWIPWRPHADGECPIMPISPIGDCSEVTCGGCPTIRKGFYPRRQLGKPPDTCDDTTSRDTRRGYEFQTKIAWVGNAAIRRFRLHAKRTVEKGTSTP